MFWFINNNKSIAKQAASIKVKFSEFDVTFNRASLKAVGYIQPTARSERYKVQIKYYFKEAPEIKVLEPGLITNFNGDKIPHVYSGNELCLYQPRYREFTASDYISDTIIPWTSLWLYHYEVWHMTGEWKGGGEHPITNI